MQVCWLQWKQSLRNWNTVSPYEFVAQMVEVPDGQSKQELNVLYCMYCCKVLISSVPRKRTQTRVHAPSAQTCGETPESSPTLENCAKELLSLPTSFSFARGNRSILRKPQLITKCLSQRSIGFSLGGPGGLPGLRSFVSWERVLEIGTQ